MATPPGLQQLQATGQTLGTQATQMGGRGFHGWIELGLKAEINPTLLVGHSFHNSCAIREHVWQSFKVEIQGVDPLKGIRSLGFPLDQQLGWVGIDRHKAHTLRRDLSQLLQQRRPRAHRHQLFGDGLRLLLQLDRRDVMARAVPWHHQHAAPRD